MAAAMNMRPSRPSMLTSPAGSSSAGSGACPRIAGETAALLRGARGSSLGGIVLSAIAIG